MTELDLEAIKARCDKATPGPWNVVIGNFSDDVSVVYIGYPGPKGSDQGHYNLSKDDQTFIAQARTDVPALVAEVEILRAALAEAVCEIGELDDYLDNFRAHW